MPAIGTHPPYDLMQQWVQTYGAQAGPNNVPEWQKLEAPLFAVRAMGRMVPPDENIMLPRLIPLIAGIPDHHKLRFQAVMALGRYTEWTARLLPWSVTVTFEGTESIVVRTAAEATTATAEPTIVIASTARVFIFTIIFRWLYQLVNSLAGPHPLPASTLRSMPRNVFLCLINPGHTQTGTGWLVALQKQWL